MPRARDSPSGATCCRSTRRMASFELAITLCVQNLAQYAVICQRKPIVEPEIVPNGSHPIEVRRRDREGACRAVRRAWAPVYLEGAVLKPNMVKNGLAGPKATTEVVATTTVPRSSAPCRRPCPASSSCPARPLWTRTTRRPHLNMMNKLAPSLPWSLSFSYGKALQKTCIVTWMGKTENVPAAQAAPLARAKANSRPAGHLRPGSCVRRCQGHVEMQGGAY